MQQVKQCCRKLCAFYSYDALCIFFFFLNNVFHGASKWYTLQQSKSQLSLIAFKYFDWYVGSNCTNMSSGSFLILDMPLVMMGDNLRYTFSQLLLLYIVLDIRLDGITLIQIIRNTNNNSKALVPIFFWVGYGSLTKCSGLIKCILFLHCNSI